MRKNEVYLAIFVLGILLASFAPSPILKVNSAIDVNLVVENVFWGNPPNNIITATPGSTNVPLTVIIHNNSNETLRGVIGYLDLIYPFTDYVTESNRSRAEGQPLQAGDVFNQTGDILPSGSLSLTFNLNIDENAVKGHYYMNLTIEYNVKSGSFFVTGVPKKFLIDVILNNQPPIIYSANPAGGTVNLFVGEWANFSIKARDPDNDTLTARWEFDGVKVGEGFNYTLNANESEIGSHTLEVIVSDGNLTTSNTWTVNINRRVNTEIDVSSNYIYAGRRSKIWVNITNNIWVGTVTVTVTPPQQLALLSDNSYTFENVTVNQTLSIELEFYASEGYVGQTIPVTITVAYRDENGNNYNDNTAISLVVRGLIEMKVYELRVTPNPTSAGSKISITGTLLNMGNVLARFTNISILNTTTFHPEFESYVYIGDVDANSPTPFTITGYLDNGLANGTYVLYFKVYYTDDLYEQHSFIFKVAVTVVNISSSGGSSSNTGGLGVDANAIYALSAIIVVIVALVAYIRRRGE
ncbi:MAG: COG1361 S-layer family protein [Candidatus Njordarchaeia archaeon]